ncbi:hypothetical protein IC232_23140 [Microvirga sp. BT688]|nr:hypothetical protein [Microvirga sp.]MBD2749579.1 hypothetical protein [Microvirga sp.]
MGGVRLPSGRDPKPACREYLQHRSVLWQDIGSQLFETGLTGNQRQVAH